MIVPAIRYKHELEQKFAAEIYSERYFYYVGYAYGFELPNISAQDNHYQWAVVDSKENILGYFAYSVDPSTNNVDKFGLYSFDEGNLTVIAEVYKILENLCRQYHRVEWRVIEGNHAKSGYDRFCLEHGGTISCLHDVTKDVQGNYRNIYIYEIMGQESNA